MEKVFELLEKNKLVDDEHIESTIMDGWGTTHILDFKDSLVELAEATAPPKKEPDLSAYAFVANSDMSSQHTTCPAWSCRLRRIDELARFSVLYSDHVYIQNYFEDYWHPPTNRYEEYNLRRNFAGDLKIMIRLRPLMTAGIVQLVHPAEPGLHMCHRCAEKLIPTFKEVNSALEKQVHTLSKKYLVETSGVLYLDPHFAEVPLYNIELKGSEELWETGQLVLITEHLAPPLLAKARNVPRHVLAKGIQLSKDQIRKAGIVHDSLHLIAMDIWMQYLMSKIAGLNLKYLTNRDIDISFLEAVTKDEDFRKYNDVLKSYLMYELPILQGVPLDSLLDVRQKEQDAFLLYRDGINEVIRTYISQRKAFSSRDAKEIYGDVIQPKLNQLNARVSSIKRSHWKKVTRDIVIAAGVLTFGLCSNILTPGWSTVVSSLGGFQALKSIQSIVEATQTPEEIRNDNFYFLWKLSKKYK